MSRRTADGNLIQFMEEKMRAGQFPRMSEDDDLCILLDRDAVDWRNHASELDKNMELVESELLTLCNA